MGILTQYGSDIGGIDDNLVAKIGTDTLQTEAQDLSGAINEHEYSIISIINGKADKSTTLSGYGITDANISNGVITLGENTITPLTSHQDISGKVNKSGDTMTGVLTMAGTDIKLGTSSSSSNDSADIAWFYGNDQEKSRIWTDTTYTTIAGPNYRVYKEDGTSLYSGKLALHNKSDHLAPISNGTRLTSADQQGDYNASLFTFMATSSMTTNKPPEDAHIIHSCWDNGGGWDVQLAIGHSNAIYTRSMNGGTWTAWKKYAYVDSTLPLSGGTLTGNLKVGNLTLYSAGSNGGINSMLIGDDVTIGDCNAGGCFGMKSTGNNAGFKFYNSSGGSIGGLQSTNGTLQWLNSSGTAYNVAHTGNCSTGDSNGQVKIAGTNIAVKGLTAAAYNGQYSRSSTGGLDWGTNNNYLVQKNVLAYWNGTYNGSSSNLSNCNRGAFGTIVTKNTGDYLATSGNGSLSGTITNAGYFKQKCQGLTGICASGRNDGHTYQFNWNSSSKLEMWVDTTNVASVSDRRLKYDIEEVTSNIKLLDIIDNCKMYTYKTENRNGQISMGIMAQDFIAECEKSNLNPEDYEVFGCMQYTNDDETEYYTIEYDQYAVIKCAALERRVKQLEEIIMNMNK